MVKQELKVIDECAKLMEPLSREEAQRVLTWLHMYITERFPANLGQLARLEAAAGTRLS